MLFEITLLTASTGAAASSTGAATASVAAAVSSTTGAATSSTGATGAGVVSGAADMAGIDRGGLMTNVREGYTTKLSVVMVAVGGTRTD